MKSPRLLIDALNQRRNTIYKVAVVIVEMQKRFFHEGISCLCFLTMKDVADKIRVHVSTVSRTVANKDIQTPQGILPMRYFFSGGSLNENGIIKSWESIKQKISEIITQEDKSNPLNDDEIAIKMKNDMGVKMARRTITKYRKSMGILSSRERKEF